MYMYVISLPVYVRLKCPGHRIANEVFTLLMEVEIHADALLNFKISLGVIHIFHPTRYIGKHNRDFR